METFRDYAWELSYRSAGTKSDGTPVNILHDFYIPALERAVSYDRVAGYFRSTSLAAASEGYTAFLQHGGAMRLIVGADMAVQDVEAILAGNQERMTKQLLSELEHIEEWPEEVVNGVALLAKMVASGHLEVKVAFRKNVKTGKAISVDSTEDGYVHEKWFIMKDSEGNRLRGSGSLNESRTALVLNAENIDINCDWEALREKQRVEESKQTFDCLWKNQDPHMEVLPLPQAVKQRLVKLRTLRGEPTEVDGTKLKQLLPKQPIEPSAEEVLRFAVLKDAPKMPGGLYVGMYSAPVAPWPHQEMVSRRLVESWPYSYLMCDEVGLGKTIEAALAIRSLVLSGRARRVLIAAPASLTNQWQHELAEKAMLFFELSKPKPGQPSKISHSSLQEAEEEYSDHDLYKPDFNIVSTGLISRKERQSMLEQADAADIILLDEAHYARRSNPRAGYNEEPKYGNLYRCLDNKLRKKAKSLWMATATPMQIDPIEVYDLIRLTKRIGPFAQDAYLTQAYFNMLGRLIHQNKRGNKTSSYEWKVWGKSFLQLKNSDPYLQNILEKTVIDSRNRHALEDLWKNGRMTPGNARDLIKPLFSASPLSRVMMRHTRKLLDEYRNAGILKSNLAKRDILPLAVIKFTEDEASFYNDLQEYCNGLMKQIRKNNTNSKQMMVFLLNFLQLRFASSIYAIQQTLKRRLTRVELSLKVDGKTFETQESLDEYLNALNDENDTDEDDIDDLTIDALLKDRSPKDLEWEKDRLNAMLKQLEQMQGVPSKIQYLLNILSERYRGQESISKQTVIFTRFFDSLTSIKNYIDARAPGMHVGVYSGKSTCWYNENIQSYIPATRDEIKHLFLSGHINILLCTDAAAEGLNLQTADLLINFDMGWNPMKIEQRIGRIDRIGHKHDVVHILNMCYLGSAEETVYGRLLERLREASGVVGTQQISMLPIEPEDFRNLQNKTITEDELTRKAKAKLIEQRKSTEKMELDAKKQFEIYRKEHNLMEQKHYPAKLEDLWDAIVNSSYLQQHGMKLQKTEDGTHISIPPIDEWGGLQGASSRDTVDDNHPLITWGEPHIDAFFSLMEGKLQYHKDYIHRISIPVNYWEIVGYLVATENGTALITSYQETKNLRIEHRKLTNEEIQQASEKLLAIAQNEADIYDTIQIVGKINNKLADTQERLVQAVAIGLLRSKENEGFELFKDALKSLEEHPNHIYPLPLPRDLSSVRESCLFDIRGTSSEPTINVVGILTQSALTLCRQVYSRMKLNKSDKQKVTCQKIIESIQKKS